MTEINEIQKVEPAALQPIDPASPAGLMAQLMGTDGPFDVEGFGKMLEYQERHEANQARKAYHVAMAEFQAESPKIIKQKSGHNNKYAGLSDIVAVIAPLESKHGLSHSWVTGTADKEIKVICKITHILGHSENTELSAGPDTTGSKNDIQALGSTITYLQRYTLKAALGLAEADQDDDGKSAGKKPIGIAAPTDEEQEAIEAICVKIPAPDGKRVDFKKVAAICYEKEQSYPDMALVDRVVAWFAKFDRPEIFIPESKDDFDESVEQYNREHDVPEDRALREAEATAKAKFGEETEQVPCRYECKQCDREFEEPTVSGKCPFCISDKIKDRQES